MRRMFRRIDRLCLATPLPFLLCLLPPTLHAVERPLWEAGAGIGVASFQDYRGSDQRTAYAIPLPYLVYRGDFLQVDRNRIRGLFFQTDAMAADFSVYGSTPVRNNDARRGMPDLDPLLEIGPQLSFFLRRGNASGTDVTLRLPVRTARRIGSDFGENAGWLFNPTLDLEWRQTAWRNRLSAGPLFADRKYHDYFYGVAPQHAMAGRPAYAARGGYSGFQLLANTSRRFSNIWVGAFVQADYLRGTAFEDSPMVKKDIALSAGFGISWVFAESEKRVNVPN